VLQFLDDLIHGHVRPQREHAGLDAAVGALGLQIVAESVPALHQAVLLERVRHGGHGLAVLDDKGNLRMVVRIGGLGRIHARHAQLQPGGALVHGVVDIGRAQGNLHLGGRRQRGLPQVGKGAHQDDPHR